MATLEKRDLYGRLRRETIALDTDGDIAPAVGFAAEEGDALAGGCGEREGGEIGGERSQGELIDDSMAFIIPGEAGKLGEAEHRQDEGEEGFSTPCWIFFHGLIRNLAAV